MSQPEPNHRYARARAHLDRARIELEKAIALRGETNARIAALREAIDALDEPPMIRNRGQRPSPCRADLHAGYEEAAADPGFKARDEGDQPRV